MAVKMIAVQFNVGSNAGPSLPEDFVAIVNKRLNTEKEELRPVAGGEGAGLMRLRGRGSHDVSELERLIFQRGFHLRWLSAELREDRNVEGRYFMCLRFSFFASGEESPEWVKDKPACLKGLRALLSENLWRAVDVYLNPFVDKAIGKETGEQLMIVLNARQPMSPSLGTPISNFDGIFNHVFSSESSESALSS